MDKAFKIAVMLSAYDKLSTVVNAAVDKSQRKLKGFQRAFNGIAEKTERGMIIGEGGMQFFERAVTAAEESEVAGNRLKQVFKSMGEANNDAANKAQAYASQLQLQIGIEDEIINATQAKIATFKSVSNETARMAGIFDRATAAAFDMQATGFGDAAQNAVQLGKALEDPVKGITALRRSGITFTEAERKKIQVLVDSGKKLTAQKLILGAIEKQVGGVAKATATATSKTKVAWSEVMETIGRQLLPIVNRFANFLTNKLIPAVTSFIEKNPVLVKVLGAVAVALVTVGTAARALSFILMTNPIVLIISAIAAAALLIYKYWGKITAWFQRLWQGVKNIFSNTWRWIKNLLFIYTPAGLIYKYWGPITAWFSNTWGKVKDVFHGFWQGIKTFLLDYTPAGLIFKHWESVVAWFQDIWDKVKNIFSNAWKSIKSGFKSFFTGGTSDAQELVDKYRDVLQKNVNVGITGTPIANPLSATQLAIPLQPNNVNNNRTNYNFSPVINYSGPGGASVASQIGNDIIKQWKEYEANKKRVQF